MAGGRDNSLATVKRCGVALVFVLIINSRSDNWVSDRRYCVEALADIQVKLLQCLLFPTEQVTGLVERTPIIDRLPGSLIIDRRPGLLFELVGRQAEVCCIEACFIGNTTPGR